MSGRFDVDDFHTANKAGGPNMGAHVAHDGMMLSESERAGPPTLHMGDDKMGATAHSHHGPHMHSHDAHHLAPKGMRPHHIGGHKTMRGK